MVRLPWLIPWGSDAETVSCYSQTYHIKFLEYINSFRASRWIFCSDSIFNPISDIHIPFPDPFSDRYEIDAVVMSPPPGLVVYVLKNPLKDHQELFFFRPGDTCWTELLLPLAKDEIFEHAVTVSGKLYCTSSSHERLTADHLLIIDPVPTPPTVCSYRMEDWVKILPQGTSVDRRDHAHLVESGGELLMVRQIGSGLFLLLRPDVSKRVWSRVEGLGDRLLVFHMWSVVSLLAADVGLKKNCIYFNDLDGSDGNWKVFDLGIGMVMDASFLDDPKLLNKQHKMFVPTIC